MKYLFLLVVAMCCLQGQARETIKDSVKVDGRWRTMLLYFPKDMKADAPLVMWCHGYSGHGGAVETLCAAADRHGFACCFPQGLQDLKGKNSWNVGYPSQEGWKVDDEKAVCSMACYVQKRYHLSKRNTFLCGSSNGGELCYLLAYSNQQVFRAFGSIAGLTMEWLYKSRRPQHPVPFLEIHGTEDRTSPMEGDLTGKGGWNPFLPVPMAVNAMATYNRCEQEVRDTISYQETSKHRPIVRHRYLGGDAGTEVWLYEVIGAPHCTFTDDMPTGEVLWEFFSKYVE